MPGASTPSIFSSYPLPLHLFSSMLTPRSHAHPYASNHININPLTHSAHSSPHSTASHRVVTSSTSLASPIAAGLNSLSHSAPSTAMPSPIHSLSSHQQQQSGSESSTTTHPIPVSGTLNNNGSTGLITSTANGHSTNGSSNNINNAATTSIPNKSFAASLVSGLNPLFIAALALSCLLLYSLPPLSNVPRGRPLSECEIGSFSAMSAPQRWKDVETPMAVSALRESLRDKWVYFVGDSTLRGAFWECTSLLKREGLNSYLPDTQKSKRNETRHLPQEVRIGSSRVSYSWSPFLSNVTRDWIELNKKEFKPQLVIISVGLHDLLYSTDSAIEADLSTLTEALRVTHEDDSFQGAKPSVLFLTSPYIVDEALSGHRARSLQFRSAHVAEQNRVFRTSLASALHSKQFAVADPFELTRRSAEQNDDGLHSRIAASKVAASISVVCACHLGIAPFDFSAAQLTLFWFSLALFGALLYSFVSATAHSNAPPKKHAYSVLPVAEEQEHGVVGLEKEVKSANGCAAANAHSSPSPSCYSLSSILHLEQTFGKEAANILIALLQLLGILLFIFIVDSDHRLTWRIIGDKLYVRDTLAFVVLSLAVASAFTWSSSDANAAILNRDQTEEWKGWMQILFVLYHYFAAKELYNLIRVFIAAYVFMTGFGNFLFFQRYADFSFVRLAKMLFRLNFFVAMVCFALERDYMQYYVCALHTTFFMFVYVFMFCGSGRNNEFWFMLSKFVLGFVTLFLIFDVPSLKIFDFLFGSFDLFYWKNSLHEWRFRSTLDHFATFVGMLFAWQIHRLDQFYLWLEKLENKRLKHGVTVSVVPAILFVFALWCRYLLTNSKTVYNQHNPYTSWIPILCYVLLRNWNIYLRNHHLAFFAWFGKITLETYILQFHVWLSDDAATLVFYTGSFNWPLVNFVISTIIYLYLAQCVFHVTTVLSDAIIPAKGSTALVVSRLLMVGSIFACVFTVSQTTLFLIR